MRSTTLFSAIALLASSTIVSAGLQPARQPYKANDVSIYGCYASSGELAFVSKAQYQDNGNCGRTCRASLKQVGATVNGTDCWCGDHYPPKSTLAEDGKCNRVCTGFSQACGGFPDGDTYFFTVFNSGLVQEVSDSPDNPSSTSGPSPTKSGDATSTVVVTEAPKSSGPNTAGIAAGVVVSVVAVAGIVGAAFWFIRRKRNREIEDEHQRAAAINSFVNGRQGPGSSGGHSAQDSRLDPVMAQHRLSSGSIADNHDYSRKILRVTNA